MYIIYVISFFRWLLHRFIFGTFKGAYFGLIHPSAVVRVKNRVLVKDRLVFWRGSSLIVEGICEFHGKVTCNDFSRIVAKKKIVFHGDVLIAQMVTVLDHDHQVKNGITGWGDYVSEPIEFGSNIWLGDKVTVLKGVTIGDNVIIGANSLVSGNIESNGVYAGLPVKIIKSYNVE